MEHANREKLLDANTGASSTGGRVSSMPVYSGAPPGRAAPPETARSQSGSQSVPNITYGYARVSSRSQNLARQVDALIAYGVQPKYIISDKASGKDFARPGYTRLMRRLKPGDTLVVGSIDRFGRNYDEIIQEWKRVTSAKQANIVVLDMPLLDTRVNKSGLTDQLINDIVLQILSYVAQTERDFIRKRQAEGIKAAQARGVKFGRPKKERPSNYKDICKDVDTDALSVAQAAELLGVCPTTFRKWRRDDSQH